MVRLKKFIKAYKQAGAFNSLLAPHRFIDEHVFLTKGNQVGVVLRAQGIDYECLTESTLESHTKRAAAAWRSFDERFRLYQYVLKQDRAPINEQMDYDNPAVLKTILARKAHLESKTSGLYSIQLFYVLLYEQPVLAHASTAKRSFSTKQILRIATDELKRNCAMLLDRTRYRLRLRTGFVRRRVANGRRGTGSRCRPHGGDDRLCAESKNRGRCRLSALHRGLGGSVAV